MTQELYNLDAERSLIGCCILGQGDCLKKLKGRLYADHFYSSNYKVMYKKLVEMNDFSMLIDSVTLLDNLKKLPIKNIDWQNELIGCVESVPTPSGYEYYTRIIIQHFVHRKSTELATKRLSVVSGGGDIRQLPEINREEEALLKLLDKPTDGRELLRISIEEMERIKFGYEMSTGLSEVDSFSLGLSRGRFYVVGGETSHGKTAFAIWCAVHNLIRDSKVNCYTYDISAQDYFKRMLGVVYNTSLATMYSPISTQSTRDKFRTDGEDFCKKYIENGQLVIKEYTTLDVIERDLAGDNRGLVIVDYLQTAFASDNNMSNYNVAWSIGKYIARLKELASKYNVCVMALSQYKRRMAQKDNKFQERDNNDLKESGYIEQGANIVILLDWANRRDDSFPLNDYSINISKSTFGKVGKTTVFFDPNYQQFRDKKETDYERQDDKQ